MSKLVFVSKLVLVSKLLFLGNWDFLGNWNYSLGNWVLLWVIIVEVQVEL